MKKFVVGLAFTFGLALSSHAVDLSGKAAQSSKGHLDPSGIQAPEYPRVELNSGRGGKVDVLVSIDATGAVSGAKISKSSGNVELDNAAMASASRSRYRAARDKQGHAIASDVTINYEFSPESAPKQ